MDGLICGLLLEDSQAYLFLHDIDCNFGVRLREAFRKGLLDLGSAIGAPDAADLDGEDAGTPSLV